MTLLELQLRMQLGGSAAGGGNSTAWSPDACTVLVSESAPPTPAHSGMQPSGTGEHGCMRIGEDRGLPAC